MERYSREEIIEKNKGTYVGGEPYLVCVSGEIKTHCNNLLFFDNDYLY